MTPDYKAMAEAQARLSRCNRRRVGAVIVHPVGWVFLIRARSPK